MQENDQVAYIQKLFRLIESKKGWGCIAAPPKVGVSSTVEKVIQTSKAVEEVKTKANMPQESNESMNVWKATLHKYSNQEQYISKQAAIKKLSHGTGEVKQKYYLYLNLYQVFTISDLYAAWSLNTSVEYYSQTKSSSIHQFKDYLYDYFSIESNSNSTEPATSSGVIVFDHVHESVLPILYSIFKEISTRIGIIVIPDMSVPYISSNRTLLPSISNGRLFSTATSHITPTEILPYTLAFVNQLEAICSVIYLTDHLNDDILTQPIVKNESFYSVSDIGIGHAAKEIFKRRVLIVSQCSATSESNVSSSFTTPNKTKAYTATSPLISPTTDYSFKSFPTSPNQSAATPKTPSSLEYEQYSCLMEILTYLPGMHSFYPYAFSHFRAKELVTKIKLLRSSASRFAMINFQSSIEQQIEWQYRMHYFWYEEAFLSIFDPILRKQFADVPKSEIDDEQEGSNEEMKARKHIILLIKYLLRSFPNWTEGQTQNSVVLLNPTGLQDSLIRYWDDLIESGLVLPLSQFNFMTGDEKQKHHSWYFIPSAIVSFVYDHLTHHLRDLSIDLVNTDNIKLNDEMSHSETHIRHQLRVKTHESDDDIAAVAEQEKLEINDAIINIMNALSNHENSKIATIHPSVVFLIRIISSDTINRELKVVIVLMLLSIGQRYLFHSITLHEQFVLLTECLKDLSIASKEEILNLIMDAFDYIMTLKSLQELKEVFLLDQFLFPIVEYLLHILHTIYFSGVITSGDTIENIFSVINSILSVAQYVLQGKRLDDSLSEVHHEKRHFYRYHYLNYQYQVIFMLLLPEFTRIEHLVYCIEQLPKFTRNALTLINEAGDAFDRDREQVELAVYVYLVHLYTHLFLKFVLSNNATTAKKKCRVIIPLQYIQSIYTTLQYPNRKMNADAYYLGGDNNMYDYLFDEIMSPHTAQLQNLMIFTTTSNVTDEVAQQRSSQNDDEEFTVEETQCLLNLLQFCESCSQLYSVVITDNAEEPVAVVDYDTNFSQENYEYKIEVGNNSFYVSLLIGSILLLVYDHVPLPLPTMSSNNDGTYYISRDPSEAGKEESLLLWQRSFVQYKQYMNRLLATINESNSISGETGKKQIDESIYCPYYSFYVAYGEYILGEIQSHLTPHLLLSTLQMMHRAVSLHTYSAADSAESRFCGPQRKLPRALQWLGKQFYAIQTLHYSVMYQYLTQSTSFDQSPAQLTVPLKEQCLYLLYELQQFTKCEITHCWTDKNLSSSPQGATYYFMHLRLFQSYTLYAHDQGYYNITSDAYRFILRQYHLLSVEFNRQKKEQQEQEEVEEEEDDELINAWKVFWDDSNGMDNIAHSISYHFAHTLVRLALSLAHLPIPTLSSTLEESSNMEEKSSLQSIQQRRGRKHQIRTTQLFANVFSEVVTKGIANKGSLKMNGSLVGGSFIWSTDSFATNSPNRSLIVHDIDYFQSIQCLLHAGSIYEYLLQDAFPITAFKGTVPTGLRSAAPRPTTSNPRPPAINTENINTFGSYVITVYVILATIHTYQQEYILAQDCYEHILKLFLQIPRFLDLGTLAQIQQHYGIWCIQQNGMTGGSQGTSENSGLGGNGGSVQGMVLLKYSQDYFMQSIDAKIQLYQNLQQRKEEQDKESIHAAAKIAAHFDTDTTHENEDNAKKEEKDEAKKVSFRMEQKKDDKEEYTTTPFPAAERKGLEQMYQHAWGKERLQNYLYQLIACMQTENYDEAQSMVTVAMELTNALYPTAIASITIELPAFEVYPDTTNSKPPHSSSSNGTIDTLPTHITPVNSPTSVPPTSTPHTLSAPSTIPSTVTMSVVYHYDYATLCYFQGLIHHHYGEYYHCLQYYRTVLDIYDTIGISWTSLESLQIQWQESVVFHHMGQSIEARKYMEEIVQKLLAFHGHCYLQILMVLESLKIVYQDLFLFPEIDQLDQFIAEIQTRYMSKLAVQFTPYIHEQRKYLDTIIPDWMAATPTEHTGSTGSTGTGTTLTTSPPLPMDFFVREEDEKGYWRRGKHITSGDSDSSDSDSNSSEEEEELRKRKGVRKVKKGKDPNASGFYFAYAIPSNRPAKPTTTSSTTGVKKTITKKKKTKTKTHPVTATVKTQNSLSRSNVTPSTPLAYDFEALSHPRTFSDMDQTLYDAAGGQSTTTVATPTGRLAEGLTTRWQQIMQILPSSQTNLSEMTTGGGGGNNNAGKRDLPVLATLQSLHQTNPRMMNALGQNIIDEESGRQASLKRSMSGPTDAVGGEEEEELPSGNACVIM